MDPYSNAKAQAIPTGYHQGGLDAPKVTGQPPLIPNLMEELQKHIAEGHQILEILENRLQPILRLEPSSPSESSNRIQPATPSLPEMLRERISSVRMLNVRISSLVHRLEV